jgi:hypothetical protein
MAVSGCSPSTVAAVTGGQIAGVLIALLRGPSILFVWRRRRKGAVPTRITQIPRQTPVHQRLAHQFHHRNSQHRPHHQRRELPPPPHSASSTVTAITTHTTAGELGQTSNPATQSFSPTVACTPAMSAASNLGQLSEELEAHAAAFDRHAGSCFDHGSALSAHSQAMGELRWGISGHGDDIRQALRGWER